MWDVDGMLEEMPARLMDEWTQYIKVRAWEAEQSRKKNRR